MALAFIKLDCPCGESATLNESQLAGFLEDELSVRQVMMLAERFRCYRCGERGEQLIHDDKERLLYDPERVRYCTGCGEIIPYARIQAFPESKLCTACITSGSGPQAAEPYPQPDAEDSICPRCGEPTAMYQNKRFKNWFVGCSTFPKCRWSKGR